MSSWRDLVLGKITALDNRLVSVVDPDSLLHEEKLRHAVEEQGYVILPYEDAVTFRYVYESEYRQMWDRGKKTETRVILHDTVGDRKRIPYDLSNAGTIVKIGLNEVFPGLSYPVIQEIGRQNLDRLHSVLEDYNGERIGDGRTIELVLNRLYDVEPNSIRNDMDVLKTMLKIHYEKIQLPPILEDHLLKRFLEIETSMGWPHDGLSSEERFMGFLQEAWEEYLSDTISDVPPRVRFDDRQVRLYTEALFLEGRLKPVAFPDHSRLPKWAMVGVAVEKQRDAETHLEGLLSLIEQENPAKNEAYQDWQKTALRWAEAIYNRHKLGNDINPEIVNRFQRLGESIETLFRNWILKDFGTLIYRPYRPRPIMAHHIPRFIASQQADKIALIVFDGLSLDQWLVMKEQLGDGFRLEEHIVCSWIPTLTSISRRSIFSGNPPRYFDDTLLDTGREERHWIQFWQDEGYKPEQIGYARGLRLKDEKEIESVLSDPRKKILGLVVNTVDNFMHHAQMGTSEMHNQVRMWTGSSVLRRSLTRLLEKGFDTYICSDHGNVTTIGIGEPQQGVLVEFRGKRSRIYEHKTFLETALEEFHDSIVWPNKYLTPRYHALLADGLTAFTREGEEVVAHGGISIEEVLVPFVHVARGE